jgi:hypothetical protein
MWCGVARYGAPSSYFALAAILWRHRYDSTYALKRANKINTISSFILGWCILLRLYINEKIKLPLFATISHRVFIIYVSHYMFRLHISHLQVYYV